MKIRWVKSPDGKQMHLQSLDGDTWTDVQVVDHLSPVPEIMDNVETRTREFLRQNMLHDWELLVKPIAGLIEAINRVRASAYDHGYQMCNLDLEGEEGE